MNQFNRRITLALTGASGAPYGLRLLQQLIAADSQVYLLLSDAAKIVLATEADFSLPDSLEQAQQMLTEHFSAADEQIKLLDRSDWFSAPASGSSSPKQMIICPCSMGTLSAIRHGASNNLIERAADVILKERGQLIIAWRESPLSTIHLENMHALSQMGVTMMPLAPGFYHKPQSLEEIIDFMVARILDHLDIEQSLVLPWMNGQ
ncbi:flavin prenyltransferase UbiX [Psychrobium sp. 1_MG-2023]|uniref:flavin prenyltransferase UbiX n=1 Tax=Psychrobium sp. 1_MG-2023 TaxID=3062624 RepID=UPI000C32E57D|nr:flavin prenyltransferase UbiX [Psychrobium sp. 1_MG-2023]MDP2561476.1 flavin prenyltransferase UbiX [Psychrobium sp. 1_MG-2023]PKF57743.1 aromatic acid decarboxylase [Alteromonadales bacterium alter-6D02]